jgi:hypothetical protein
MFGVMPSITLRTQLIVCSIVNDEQKHGCKTLHSVHVVHADSVMLANISSYVRNFFAPDDGFRFEATWMLVVTWLNVTFKGGNATTVSDFVK